MASAAKAASADRVFTRTSITLYSPEFVWEKHGPSAQVLSDYISALTAVAQAGLSKSSPINASGALVVALKPPAKSRFWFVTGSQATDDALMKRLDSNLVAVSPPRVRGVLALAIEFTSGSGGKGPERIQGVMALPDDWKTALSGRGGRIPDDALAVVWPD